MSSPPRATPTVSDPHNVSRSSCLASTLTCCLAAGFTHAAPLLNGQNFYQVFNQFYFYEATNVTSASFKLADTCGVMCNPTCSA